VPTVLVVDDEPLVRNMVALMLEKDGFSVLTAGNGPDAIHLSRSHHGRIDLLVSDVRMPAMDGCTLASELQAEDPSLPVLLISGYCENQPAESQHRFPLLPKPFSMATLLGKVRDLLNHPIRRAPAVASPQLTSAGAGRGREET
jgi:two-component system, cell cycle sensor histidine kinase and response regulator CckA